eukprot:431603-Prymnesium_polylepis.1
MATFLVQRRGATLVCSRAPSHALDRTNAFAQSGCRHTIATSTLRHRHTIVTRSHHRHTIVTPSSHHRHTIVTRSSRLARPGGDGDIFVHDGAGRVPQHHDGQEDGRREN